MIDKIDIVHIKQHVDNRYFHIDRIIEYLTIHEIVGNEIFKHSLKDNIDPRIERVINQTFRWLEGRHGYTPLPVKTFLKRLQFYYYIPNEDFDYGCLGFVLGGKNSLLTSDKDHDNKEKLEELYNILESMYYEYNIEITDIFQYVTKQTGYVSENEIFLQWYHYLKLCKQLSIKNPTPDNFIYEYNMILEKSALEPIIYEINFTAYTGAFHRTGNRITFEGIFPCDENKNPVMKWIGLRVKNVNIDSCSCEKGERGELTFEIKPNSVIHALNIYNDSETDEDNWYQLYAGPQHMEFNCSEIKRTREKFKYTQKQVAEAVGASVRTYQKWESGETTPDGHYLLRILNWLDISDVQDVITFTN